MQCCKRGSSSLQCAPSTTICRTNHRTMCAAGSFYHGNQWEGPVPRALYKQMLCRYGKPQEILLLCRCCVCSWEPAVGLLEWQISQLAGCALWFALVSLHWWLGSDPDHSSCKASQILKCHQAEKEPNAKRTLLPTLQVVFYVSVSC